jgi:hypothetical protein
MTQAATRSDFSSFRAAGSATGMSWGACRPSACRSTGSSSFIISSMSSNCGGNFVSQVV